MNSKIFTVFVLILFLISCNQPIKKETKPSDQTTNIFINPPLKNIDVPFKQFKVDAAKGDTLFYQTGSILLFPPNAFVDRNGDVVQGSIDINYREFTNPVDFYLSGIPMDYDSVGKKYSFESAAMCELHAYKDGTPVYVNLKSKPEINVAGNNNSQTFSLYYLDTVQKNWINKGAAAVTNVNDLNKGNKTATIKPGKTTEELIEPVKPEKANNKSPVIQLVIDPASFKELLVYNNLKFQVDPAEKNVNANDTAEEWSNVELEKGNSNGLYTLKFSNDKRTVFYAARPVLEGKDYEKALAIFEKNNEEYKRKLSARITKEKAIKEKYQQEYLKDSLETLQFLAEKDRIDKLNILIKARNKEIEAENINILRDNKWIEKQKAKNEARRKEIEKWKKERANIDSIEQVRQQKEMDKILKEQEISAKAAHQLDTIINTFQIDGFGIWNCDRVYSSYPLYITANYEDEKGNELALSNVAVVYTSIKGLFMFGNGIQIEVAKNADNMILGTYNGKLYYISYLEYRKLNIGINTKQQIFPMAFIPDGKNSYDYIKEMIK